MSTQVIGQAAALLTAVIWAFALVLFKFSGERVTPMALNLFKVTVGLVLTGATIVALVLLGFDDLHALQHTPAADIGLLLLSGFIGIALADTLFFHALNLIGVGLVAIIDCCYLPSVIVYSWALLGEQLAPLQYIGAALVIAGVFTATRHQPPANRTRGQLLFGMLLALLSISAMAFGIVMVKRVLESTPTLWSTVWRLLGGLVPLVLFSLVSRTQRRNWRVFVPSSDWRVTLPAAVLGTYVCLILWIAGFKYTSAPIAGALNQTSVVFQTLLATLILREPYGLRQAAALVLAFCGALVLTIGPAVLQHFTAAPA
jgi:drug/metabolite transporter (DMT)-like permease